MLELLGQSLALGAAAAGQKIWDDPTSDRDFFGAFFICVAVVVTSILGVFQTVVLGVLGIAFHQICLYAPLWAFSASDFVWSHIADYLESPQICGLLSKLPPNLQGVVSNLCSTLRICKTSEEEGLEKSPQVMKVTQ